MSTAVLGRAVARPHRATRGRRAHASRPAARASAAPAPKDSHVVVETAEELADALREAAAVGVAAVVLVTTSQCPPCLEFAPRFGAIAADLTASNARARFVTFKVRCGEAAAAARERMGVRDVPSCLVYHGPAAGEGRLNGAVHVAAGADEPGWRATIEDLLATIEKTAKATKGDPPWVQK